MAKTKELGTPVAIGKDSIKVTDSEVDMKDLTLNIQAARMKAQRKAPYFGRALFAMRVIFDERVAIAASDEKWRMYLNPKAIQPLTVDQISGIFIHEISHQLRNHIQRFQMLHQPDQLAMVHNIAGDVLINEDLTEDGFLLPDGLIFVKELKKMYGIDLGVAETRKLSTEEIFFLIKEAIEKNCTCGKHGLENKSDKQDQEGEGQGGSEGQEESEQSNDKGKGKGKESDKSEGSEQGEGEGEGEGKDQDSKGQGNGTTSEEDCPVHGHNHSKDGSGEPCPACGTLPDCGSATDGIRRDYEEAGEAEGKGVSKAEADLIRRGTADDILKYVSDPSNSRGTMPAGWLRWAEEFEKPAINWRRELASIIRKTFGSIAGKRDYHYTRPSRRQAAFNQSTGRTNGNTVILPAMRAPEPPKIAVVIDTSGSMSDEYLAWALAETDGVLKSIGQARSVRFISCDASAHVQDVRKAKDIKLIGGGGTDMCVGIEAALQGKNKAQVVIVLTDGYTPWPTEPLKNATLIVGLTDEASRESVPDWARCVIIARDKTDK